MHEIIRIRCRIIFRKVCLVGVPWCSGNTCLMTWVVPPPSNSGKWRFIGIPDEKIWQSWWWLLLGGGTTQLMTHLFELWICLFHAVCRIWGSIKHVKINHDIFIANLGSSHDLAFTLMNTRTFIHLPFFYVGSHVLIWIWSSPQKRRFNKNLKPTFTNPFRV